MLSVGSVFAGIGGLELGLERTGEFRTEWQIEIDPDAIAVLKKHWPHAKRYGDIRTVHGHELTPVDLICGGFPCQDISDAGKKAGITGRKSGLWGEYARIVREVQPRYVLVENVAALLGRGLDRVLGDLAALGYDAEWDCIPASAVGAPHRRDRIFILAYSSRVGKAGQQVFVAGSGVSPVPARDGEAWGVADVSDPSGHLSHLRPNPPVEESGPDAPRDGVPQSMADSYCFGRPARLDLIRWRQSNAEGSGWWAVEPDVGRVAHGVRPRSPESRLLQRQLCLLGNAVVPQVAEWIGHRILHREVAFARRERPTGAVE